LGDVVGVSQHHFTPYMNKAMQVLDFASERVIKYDRNSTDDDFTEYIQNLVIVLIETYTCII